MVLCPECETDLDLDEEDLESGDVVSCSECGTELEVITTEPLELAPVSEEDEEDDEKVKDADDEEEE